MGTHPIFESDFDCLTEKHANENRITTKKKRVTKGQKTFFDHATRAASKKKENRQ